MTGDGFKRLADWVRRAYTCRMGNPPAQSWACQSGADAGDVMGRFDWRGRLRS
jgi:hypothetical protein